MGNYFAAEDTDSSTNITSSPGRANTLTDAPAKDDDTGIMVFRFSIENGKEQMDVDSVKAKTPEEATAMVKEIEKISNGKYQGAACIDTRCVSFNNVALSFGWIWRGQGFQQGYVRTKESSPPA
eukprot:gb/GEZN01027841.1/.p1 GENE.gb/GEZN01027841.1/~~gb/GEZN01027841.1/.p1  ORF type:complete len:124 (-),score=14.43 gb/GEZN01027841.1/:42-413(-)